MNPWTTAGDLPPTPSPHYDETIFMCITNDPWLQRRYRYRENPIEAWKAFLFDGQGQLTSPTRWSAVYEANGTVSLSPTRAPYAGRTTTSIGLYTFPARADALKVYSSFGNPDVEIYPILIQPRHVLAAGTLFLRTVIVCSQYTFDSECI